MNKNALRTAFVILAITLVLPQQSLLEAQSNNCTCQGIYYGLLPTPLQEPVCVQSGYYANFFSFTAQSCEQVCAAYANNSASSTCGATCDRGGQTYNVVSYYWQGNWFFSPGGSGYHDSGLPYTSC